ncbi:MAG: hypothetical protein QNJ54_35600, partial [Prochloraceae cyanobacterium]|nr:hypothetical protein [Prochloraceae cyanobacterium]
QVFQFLLRSLKAALRDRENVSTVNLERRVSGCRQVFQFLLRSLKAALRDRENVSTVNLERRVSGCSRI